MMGIASVNPATGEVLRRFEPHSSNDIEARVARAAELFPRWRDTPVGERAAVLARAGELLTAGREGFARTMTLEMGKTLASARSEVDKCAAGCRFYADNAARFLTPELVDGPDHHVAFEPLGTVLAVMPWNFPFWQVVRFAAPALAAGNTGLLKHASNVPQCALALEQLFRDAGAPAGAFTTLLVGSKEVAGLIADPRVAAVTVTGSEGAGRSIAEHAGKHLKKSVLELGGSDPFVVRPSADFERTVTMAVEARCINNGQSCIAAKRFIVDDAIYDRFGAAFVQRMKALPIGDPMAEGTRLGPLATPAILEGLDDQVQRSVAAGARLLCGGKRRPGPGNFYEPTVLADVPPQAAAYNEELFGPVATLLRARDADHAIALANDSGFGLGPASGPATARRPSASRARSPPARCSSTAWSPPTPVSPSGGSSGRGTGVSWGCTGCASSSTSRPSGCSWCRRGRARPPPVPHQQSPRCVGTSPGRRQAPTGTPAMVRAAHHEAAHRPAQGARRVPVRGGGPSLAAARRRPGGRLRDSGGARDAHAGAAAAAGVAGGAGRAARQAGGRSRLPRGAGGHGLPRRGGRPAPLLAGRQRAPSGVREHAAARGPSGGW
jgi:succinate-semialdehyde dehydrogenase/glutarate-semialdehyde dehydrogenase